MPSSIKLREYNLKHDIMPQKKKYTVKKAVGRKPLTKKSKIRSIREKLPTRVLGTKVNPKKIKPEPTKRVKQVKKLTHKTGTKPKGRHTLIKTTKTIKKK